MTLPPPPPLPLQYAYSKHHHWILLRGGQLEPLLQGEAGGAPQAEAEAGAAAAPAAAPPQLVGRPDSHFLLSKLFWGGVALQALGLGLLGLTLHTLLAPPV